MGCSGCALPLFSPAATAGDVRGAFKIPSAVFGNIEACFACAVTRVSGSGWEDCCRLCVGGGGERAVVEGFLVLPCKM